MATLLLSLALTAAACGGKEAPRQISNSGFGAYEVSLAALGDRLAVGWYDTRDQNAEIYLRLVDPADNALGPEYRLSRTLAESYEVDLAAFDDGLAFAWYEKDGAGRLAARLAFWSESGGIAWELALGEAGLPSRNPVVRAAGDRIFVAWIQTTGGEREAIYAAWLDRAGRMLGPVQQVGAASQTTWALNAALTDGGSAAWVGFDAMVDTAAEEIYLARIAAGEIDIQRLTADDGFASKYPDFDFVDDRLALAWSDERDGNPEVYLATATVTSLAMLESFAARITQNGGESIGAYLAIDGGRIGLAWSDEIDGRFEVFFQYYDTNGKPIGRREQISETGASSLMPAIVPWQGGFAVAWNELLPGPPGAGTPGSRSEVKLAVVR